MKMGKRCASGPAASKEWPWLHSIEPGQADHNGVARMSMKCLGFRRDCRRIAGTGFECCSGTSHALSKSTEAIKST